MANIRATFSINAAGTVWGAIEGSLANQTDLANALNAKQNVITDLDTIRSNAENGNSAYQTIGTYGDIVTYNASDFATATQGGLADSALQPNDNITELTNNAGYITSASVGNGTLTIQKNSTDVGTFSANQSTNKTINITVPTTASDVGALPDTTTINDLTSTEQQAALNSGATSSNISQIATNTSAISTINGKIPSAASTTNQLADKQFVNNAIQTNSAHFRGNWATWSAVPTNSADYPTDDDGNKTPTTNDYIVVEDASGYTEETLEGAWQFTYTGTWATNGKNGWLPRFQINESPLTPAQLAALNSGATTTNIGQITTNQNAIGTLSSLTTTAKTDLVSAINELDSDKQDNITDLSTIRSGASKGATSIQPGDNISELTNNAGYTTNVGTVTSVNNNSPDANGNVSITIPTVNNATLTIQKNGTNVSTFTANANSNVTANITVPTDVSDLTNTTLANTDLGNLSETGNNRLHALKAYTDSGEYLYDAEGLSDVTDYAHSTFDKSKFTVVGSTTITDDGIASNFSAYNNYFSTGTLSQHISGNNWKIRFKLFIPATGDMTFMGVSSDATTSRKSFQLAVYQTSLWAYLGDGTTGQSFGNNRVVRNSNMIFEVGRNGTKYYTELFDENYNSIKKVEQDVQYDVDISSIVYIGGGLGGQLFTGSFDLKQFSITVDGVEVFSGNRTGIDTIKPDDYTVVGTPTISADGVASGFSNSNYINVPSDFLSANAWKIEYPISTTQTNQAGIIAILTDFCLQIVYTPTNKQINYALSSNGSSWDIGNSSFVASTLDNTKDSIFVIEFTGTKYEMYFIQNGIKINGATLTSSSKLYASSNKLILGNNRGLSSVTNGSIDLNAFKIYVDGNLVCQPCLRIPYTETSDNGRVVNYIYRDRALDAYTQYGSYNSYTLQEDNVPNYSVVGSPTISSDYVVSGFSSGNYVKSTLTLGELANKSWKIKGTFLPNSGHDDGITLSNTANQFRGSVAYKISGSKVYVGATFVTGTSSSNASKNDLGSASNLDDFTTSDTIHWAFEYNHSTGTYSMYADKIDGTTLLESYTATTANTQLYYINESPTDNICIGFRGSHYNTGSFDLKTFDVITNGKLSYQAVIPPNFTLPCGDVYGMIGQESLKESKVSGINREYLYSNRKQILTGSCTSGVEVTLPTPFANANYALTIPYSAKSATAFTPTATGDWIAFGEGVL